MITMSGIEDHKVYVCSALRGDMEENMAKARCYCRYVAEEHGYLPVAPHIYFTQFLNDDIPKERDFGIQAGLLLLSRCDELWYFGDTVSKGMTEEICEALRFGIPVRYISEHDYENYLHERKYETNEMQ